MQILTKRGSATSARPCPSTQNLPGRGVIIAHIANSSGRWGAGFVLAVNDLSLAARNAYRAFCKDHNDQVPLGTTQFVEVKPDVWVANMIAQNGTDKSKVPDGCLVDYAALNKCLEIVFERAVVLGCNVHIPSGMGSGLAGGDETMIHEIIKTRTLCTSILLLEKQMMFDPIVTLWDFQDTAAESFVGKPAAPKQAMVASVFGAPDGGGDDDVLNIDDVLENI